MKIEDLSPDVRQRIGGMRFDWFVEKHEGPWDWKSFIEAGLTSFITIEGYDVLLPVEEAHHPNISVVRSIFSEDDNVLTIFLTDTTYFTEMFSGFFAVCEKVPGEEWYIALLYHEWFVIEDVPTQYRSASS